MDTPELASLPQATGLPSVDEADERAIEFAHDGKRHSVKVRPPSWGRAKALQQGLRVESYAREIDGEKREITIQNPEQQAGQVESLFRIYVKEINGMPWTARNTVDELNGEWVQAFLKVFMPSIATSMEEARKKSSAQ